MGLQDVLIFLSSILSLVPEDAGYSLSYAIEPITMGLLIAGGSSLIKGGIDAAGRSRLSREQGRMADELERRFKRPNMPINEYQIPDALYQNRDLALAQYYDQMLPGQSYIENQVQGATGAGAGAVARTGGSSADVLAAISSLYQGEQQQMAAIGQAGAEMQMRDLDRLMGANNAITGAEMTAEQYRLQQLQQKWQFEEADPYLFAMQSAARLREAQGMNKFNALSSMGNMIGEVGYMTGTAAMMGAFGGASSGPQAGLPMITPQQWGGFTPEQQAILSRVMYPNQGGIPINRPGNTGTFTGNPFTMNQQQAQALMSPSSPFRP